MSDVALTPVLGMLDTAQVPAGIAHSFSGSNAWQAPSGNTWLQVYAGALKSDDGSTGIGAVALYEVEFDGEGGFNNTNLGVFAAPIDLGILSIESVVGDIVSLVDPDGVRIQFDLQSRQFVVQQ